MDNATVARILLDIAGLLERKRESHFKIWAYRQAAQRVEGLPVGIEQVMREGRLREIPGVGEAIA
ncbi:MAG: helix-hairpin-helix domain-containing protein [Dehalococcoidia bacterium]